MHEQEYLWVVDENVNKNPALGGREVLDHSVNQPAIISPRGRPIAGEQARSFSVTGTRQKGSRQLQTSPDDREPRGWHCGYGLP